MGADLSFERPKCRYPNPNNKKNQVGPSIVNDPYKNKRGQTGLNVSNPVSLLGSMYNEGLKSNPVLGSMLKQVFQPNPGLSSPILERLPNSSLDTALQSNPQLQGILSQLQNYSPEELQRLVGKRINPEQISSLMSMINPIGNSNRRENNSVPPPIPSTPPPTLPNENVSGGSKEKSVKDLRKICKRKKIKITKNGKYLTKKELLKLIHQSWQL